MQPNTSFRLRMCISPLMFRLNIIPFSPWHTGSQNCKTGLTSFATFHGSDFSDTATHSATAVLQSTNTRQTRPAELPTSTITLFHHVRGTSHIAICAKQVRPLLPLSHHQPSSRPTEKTGPSCLLMTSRMVCSVRRQYRQNRSVGL